VARLILLCGLPGAGKTTLAGRLAAARPAVRLCPDEWILALGGQLSDAGFRKRIERQMHVQAEETLSHGIDVILEFGFWSRVDRDRLRLMARRHGAAVELHHLDAPVDELSRRLAERDRTLPADRMLGISRAQLEEWAGAFEAPDAEELRLFDPAVGACDAAPRSAHHTGRSGAGP
jgi:predicted kinase